ncbi:MAG: bifunctional 3'-5' exonuclease/DNA polymerase [Acidobacteria bacterium]|nr:bifunctional 3'-5' exonuclease/DNA polymerase [Acidobacteriota bacterium]
MYVLLSAPDEAPTGALALTPLDAQGNPAGPARTVTPANLAAVVRELETKNPRWVWQRTGDFYPALLSAGVSVERCHDLTLCRNILANSSFTAHTDYAKNTQAEPMEEPLDERPSLMSNPLQDSLFAEPVAAKGPPASALASQLRAQLAALRQATEPGRLALLLAAESAGSLIAVEMQHAGLPWRTDLHEAILQEHLGPRPQGLNRPEKMEALAAELRLALNAPSLNPDSPQELMRALHRAGIEAKTTRQWELVNIKHPAIEPLLAYKKLSRLHSANGWSWLDTWVADGRFRPEYVVGGVVSGRWASRGGGALQIPKQIRGAAHADDGFKLIVADAAQLEPRVLIALAQDTKMAEAARDKDLYAGIAAQGFGGERAKAKVALLGAIYGSTTGESGRLMPQLTRTYPHAVGFVEDAARAGERGDTLTTRLGRSTPPPSDGYLRTQQTTNEAEQRRADSFARSRGRFTRNFVVQGSAADWAACWLAELRRRLRALAEEVRGPRAELVFFLHDEVMVHCPEPLVEQVSALVEDAAAAAGELLFGKVPVAFPVTTAVVDSYDKAK